jgi:hypothetical protein
VRKLPRTGSIRPSILSAHPPVVAQGVGYALHVAERVSNGLPGIQRLELRQLLRLGFDQIGQLEEQSATIRGVHRAIGR